MEVTLNNRFFQHSAFNIKFLSFVQIRKSYKAYMITMLKTVAANPHDVPAAVDEILRLEKRIAKVYVSIGGFRSRLIDRETL